MESATPVPSDSSNYGSSSLEFIIPERQQLQKQNANVCVESNINETDFIGNYLHFVKFRTIFVFFVF